jgi:hypothetical protein
VTGGWRELHNDELRNSYYSLSIFKIFKSRRMRLAQVEKREMHKHIGRKSRWKETTMESGKY